MLQPTRTKFRKAHKGRIHGNASRCNNMNYGSYGLKAIQPERVISRQIEAARVGALQQYLRPLACISIAFFADKSGNINVIITGFVIMLIGAILFASGIVQAGLNSLFIISLVIVAVGTYIIRGLYFSILRDGGIPLALSGTAIGVVSIIGYTPDIFATPLYGYFLSLIHI